MYYSLCSYSNKHQNSDDTLISISRFSVSMASAVLDSPAAARSRPGSWSASCAASAPLLLSLPSAAAQWPHHLCISFQSLKAVRTSDVFFNISRCWNMRSTKRPIMRPEACTCKSMKKIYWWIYNKVPIHCGLKIHWDFSHQTLLPIVLALLSSKLWCCFHDSSSHSPSFLHFLMK